MTDRSLPIPDGAPACPFVAFEDDRDERATSPDARHRCYAEVRPASRAHAHQDAYCLSSAFALCPTFQDWARREGARVRLHAAGEAARREEAARRDEAAWPEEPQRNPKRAWQAPPPWLAGSNADPGSAARQAAPDWSAGAGGRGAGSVGGARPPEAGLAGSLAHQIAMGGPSEPRQEPGVAGLPAGEDDAIPGPREAPGAWLDARRSPAAPVGAEADEPGEEDHPLPVGRTSGFTRAPGRPMVSEPAPRRHTGEPVAPPWERPRRYEAYPTLRTRVGLPALSRPVMLFLALVVAAGGLFLLPTLLGFNAPQASPSPVPSPTRTPLATLAPTPTIDAGPTPQVYVIQPNDTMSKIAAKFGVPLNELIEANKEAFPDPNKIRVGDQLIIPVPVPTTFPDAGSAEPSAAP